MAKKSPSQSPKDLKAQLARALADYANLEKRFERDSSSVIKFATSSLLNKLLAYRDHLARAARHLSDHQLDFLLTEFDKILASEKVVKIDTAAFDPQCMECSDLAPGPKNEILSVLRPGYTLHGRVLRPARVILGNGKRKKNNK